MLACLTWHAIYHAFLMSKLGNYIIIQHLIYIYTSINQFIDQHCNREFFTQIFSHWSTVFPPCEQFLRRLWTMTGSQVKGGSGVGATGGGTNEGRILCYDSKLENYRNLTIKTLEFFF